MCCFGGLWNCQGEAGKLDYPVGYTSTEGNREREREAMLSRVEELGFEQLTQGQEAANNHGFHLRSSRRTCLLPSEHLCYNIGANLSIGRASFGFQPCSINAFCVPFSHGCRVVSHQGVGGAHELDELCGEDEDS